MIGTLHSLRPRGQLTSPWAQKKVQSLWGTAPIALGCCAVASLPMAMAITMPPPAVTVPPINLADDPGRRGKLSN